MSLLQVQCPEGGGDFGRVQAVAGAGYRHGGPAQGAAMRDVRLHNQANAFASCTVPGPSRVLRGHAGSRKRPFVRVGANARLASAALRNGSYHLGVALGHNAPTDAGI